MQEAMNKVLAITITGGLSNTSKLPGASYSLPATACRVGSVLRRVAGSICETCYACGGRYVMRNVRDALQRRLASIYHPRWAEAMTFLISRKHSRFFRWFDSGDIQSLEMFQQIVDVCRATPDVHHWLPTKEHTTVCEWLSIDGNTLPPNLTVRFSAYMKDAVPETEPPVGVVGCMVHTSADTELPPKTHICKAYTRGGKCGNCRACWSRRVQMVSYPLHVPRNVKRVKRGDA